MIDGRHLSSIGHDSNEQAAVSDLSHDFNPGILDLGVFRGTSEGVKGIDGTLKKKTDFALESSTTAADGNSQQIVLVRQYFLALLHLRPRHTERASSGEQVQHF